MVKGLRKVTLTVKSQCPRISKSGKLCVGDNVSEVRDHIFLSFQYPNCFMADTEQV